MPREAPVIRAVLPVSSLSTMSPFWENPTKQYRRGLPFPLFCRLPKGKVAYSMGRCTVTASRGASSGRAKTCSRPTRDCIRSCCASSRRARLRPRRGSSDNNRKAKFYQITKAGRRQLASEMRQWEQPSPLPGAFPERLQDSAELESHIAMQGDGSRPPTSASDRAGLCDSSRCGTGYQPVLLLAQGVDRRETRRAQRGADARAHGDDQQKQAYSSKCQRLDRPDSEQQRGQKARQNARARDTGRHSEAGDAQSLSQHHACYARTIGAQRDADADLLAPPANRVAQDAPYAESRHDKGDGGERDQQQHRVAHTPGRIEDHGVERTDLVRRDFGADLVERMLHRAYGRIEVHTAFDNQVKKCPRRLIHGEV